jgi:hypothetical protein
VAIPHELFDGEVPDRDWVLDQGFWFDPVDRRDRLPAETMWPFELDDCLREGKRRFVDRRCVFRIAKRAIDNPDDQFAATRLLVARSFGARVPVRATRASGWKGCTRTRARPVS